MDNSAHILMEGNRQRIKYLPEKPKYTLAFKATPHNTPAASSGKTAP